MAHAVASDYPVLMNEFPASPGVVLSHATLAALTPLIPVPFVDTVARNYVMRRMVRSLAARHELEIWDEQVKTLADEKGGHFLVGIAKGAVLSPFKLVLRKTFMVLAGKHIVDLASQSYHHGYLVEHAFRQKWCAPRGGHSPTRVRAAIDKLVESEPVASSPVTRALRVGFDGSQRALADVYASLRSRLSDAPVASAIEDAAGTDDGGLTGVVASLQHALTAVPREHFEELEQKLRRELFGDDLAAQISVKEITSE